MSIAEKALQLKQDFDEVYAAGKAAGGGGNYDQGYEDGKNSVVQFDRYLKTATFTSLNMFGTSEAVLNLDNITTLARLFNVTYKSEEDLVYKNNTVERLTINCKNLVTSMQDAFYAGRTVADTKLKHLTLNFVKSGITNYNNAFNGLDMLETIAGEPFDFSSVTTTTIGSIFSFCYALIDFGVVANTIYKSFSVQHSANLSTETIQSIIDGLADLTGGTAQTLTLHKDVGAKLTDTQKATITAKNWTLVY